MTPPRVTGAVLIAVGIGIATLTSGADRQSQPQPDGTWILTADFHVHAFPGDGTLAPWNLRQEAARRGLDVIAITNHNQRIAVRLSTWLSRLSRGALAIPGEEVTSRHYHLIAVGTSAPINWDQPAADAIRDVHAQGAVAIAAHPIRGFQAGWDDRALTLVDGVEAAHSAIRNGKDAAEIRAFVSRARNVHPGIAAIGSSDFHRLAPLGFCRTYVFASEPSANAVLEAIRSGRTVAEDMRGALVGDPALVERVKAYRAQPINARTQSYLPRIGSAAAWAGLLIVLLFA